MSDKRIKIVRNRAIITLGERRFKISVVNWGDDERLVVNKTSDEGDNQIEILSAYGNQIYIR